MSDSATSKRSLPEWVDYIQTLHHREIDLSLERVRTVYQRLCPDGFKPKVISIAGTNGKGSCAELLSSLYCTAGYRVGKFTSPHLIRFNERFVLNGQAVQENVLLAAFEKIEQVRAEIGITYFEFGALLAIELFASAEVDIAIMEVGLGGRLDAINILDADVALITSISKDHTAWLGDTVEKIGFEKAGIARANKPCVVGFKQPQQSIIKHCSEIGAELLHLGSDFNYSEQQNDTHQWQWQSTTRLVEQLPLPFGQAGVQLANASVCLQAVTLLDKHLPINDEALSSGLKQAQLLARCQVLSEQPLIVLDVAHNQSSVERLRDFLRNRKVSGRLFAVCGMLEDKEVQASLAALVDLVDEWSVASIHNPRGASADYIKAELKKAMQQHPSADQIDIACHDNIVDAFLASQGQLEVDDCLVVFGSFFVAGDILALVESRSLSDSTSNE